MNTVAVAMGKDSAPLACVGVVRQYGAQTVLRNVSLEIPSGAVLGLIGRNGAGKTTLIRILLGLARPQAGQARVFGEPVLALTDAGKTRLGYVPQQPDALAWMRVGDMLEFVGRLYPRWDAGYVSTALARWRLPSQRPLAKLSPGERQLVALIRALALQPELLVLDEPAAALDPVARRELLREIALRAGESGTTVLFSSHIVSDLERVASHVAFLHEGRLVLTAPLDELAERHARLIVPAASAPQLQAPLPGELARRTRSDGSVAIVLVRSPGAPWPPGACGPGARLDVLGLEDLFIEVTEGTAA